MTLHDVLAKLFAQPQPRKMGKSPSVLLRQELEQQREIQEMWRRVTRLKSELNELRILSHGPEKASGDEA